MGDDLAWDTGRTGIKPGATALYTSTRTRYSSTSSVHPGIREVLYHVP